MFIRDVPVTDLVVADGGLFLFELEFGFLCTMFNIVGSDEIRSSYGCEDAVANPPVPTLLPLP